MQYELILAVLVFLFGSVIGSFLNVCIFRLPQKENIATTGSHCMNCSHRLRWYDLVPILSWLLLGGKCRYCKAKISVQYPLIEAANGVGYVLIFALRGYYAKPEVLALLDCGLLCLFFSCLVVLSVIDWRTYEIPIGINITILVLGILRTALDYPGLTEHLAGLVCISLFLLLLNLITGGRAMGGGDVKLMAAAGLFLGWKQVTLGFFLGCIIGSVIHLTLMKVAKKGRILAFGPYLSAGMVVAMLFGDAMIDWYLKSFM